MCHTGIFMCSLSSGQSLVIGPAAVEYLFEVWLCDFVLHNVRSLLLRKHTAICLRFECVGYGHVTGTRLFCFRRQLYFPCRTWKSFIVHSLLRFVVSELVIYYLVCGECEVKAFLTESHKSI